MSTLMSLDTVKKEVAAELSVSVSRTPSGSLASFNSEHGMLEALIRGFTAGLLKGI